MASIETQTKIKLISDAIVLCGEPPTSSLSDDRSAVTTASNLFELLYENQIQGNRWRFCVKKRGLSQLTDVPLNEWQFIYQIPTDCLLPIGVWPRRTPYEIYGDHIYSNASTLDLEYVFKPDISKLPAYFSLLMVYELYKNIAKPVTESDAHVKKAETLYNRQLSKAEYADAQSRPAQAIVDSPFTDVRG